MDIENEENIMHALTLIKQEYSDDYSEESYSMLLSEVLKLGLVKFDRSWFDEILKTELEYVIKNHKEEDNA